MHIKKIISFLLTVIIILPFFPQTAYAADELHLISDTAVLMDAKTGQILYDKQMDKVKFPASITKIPTIYLSVLGTDPNEKITVSKDDYIHEAGTHIALLDGEIVTLSDLQHAAMLMSANDACNVIARHISGDVDSFAERMNSFAKSVGCTSTNFVNPHGLPDNDHYTTAHDMALMTREAIKSKEFMEIFSSLSYEMPETNKQPARPFSTRDAMLKSYDPDYYPYAVAGKLGWTEEAHHTKVTVAEHDGRTLIAVVMDSSHPREKYEDTRKLLDYGFNEFKEYTILPQSVQNHEIPVTDGANQVGTLNMFLASPAKIYLHGSINVKDITYRFPDIKSIDKSQISSTKFGLEVVLPDYTSDVMYSTSMTLKLDTKFVPSISKVDEPPKKEQMVWLAKEIGEILLISLGLTSLCLFFIMIIFLVRKYIIIYRRKKHKRQLAIKRKKQIESMKVIERQKSPYKMSSIYNKSEIHQNVKPQYNTKPKINVSSQGKKNTPRRNQK